METSTTVPEAVAALHAGLDTLTDQVIHALRAQLPCYASVSAHALRPRVRASLRNGLSLVGRWSDEQRRSPVGPGRGGGRSYDIPATYLDEVTPLARSLPVEDLITAYRIGTDIVWRRFCGEMAARQGTAEDLLPIAETLRIWADANTLHLVRSCRAGVPDGAAADRRRSTLVRALLLGKKDAVEASDAYDRNTALRLPFRARLPDSADSARTSGDGVLTRAVDLLRPWLALDASGKPLVTTVDGDAAGLLAGRPSGLCRALIVGLGAPAPASGLAAEFAEATQALRAAAGCGLVGAFTREELGLRATVVAMPAVGEQLVRLRLAPLAERGEEGAQLEDAAAAYLRQGLRLEAAARTLYVHPNTLRNRLRRFEEITGTSLRDPADLAEIWWALTHRQVHGGSPAT
ncbi:PucR family transcriptional regulator [Streptomyces sp. NPDC053427]|uniref:PucR family transcriptional regulator n=1 Tax=Streptomyces sp. NPDC053427 TaxID=3365701 RepID=UPI0037D3E4D8